MDTPIIGSRSDPQLSPYKLRMSSEAFMASIFTLFAIALVFAFLRVLLRWRTATRFSLDDIVFIFAIITLAGATVTVAYAHNVIYLQVRLMTGSQMPAPDLSKTMSNTAMLNKCQQAAAMLLWSTIYLTKFSFLLFFQKLIRKILSLYIWWWVVFAFVFAAGMVSIPLGWMICPDTSADMLMHCSVDSMLRREAIEFEVTTALDIATDILIITAPLLITMNIPGTVVQKCSVAGILSLSVFMIIIATIRLSLYQIKIDERPAVPDTAWQFFWQLLEAAVAILMVSILALRSLYGQAREKASKKLMARRRQNTAEHRNSGYFPGGDDNHAQVHHAGDTELAIPPSSAGKSVDDVKKKSLNEQNSWWRK